MRFLSEDPLTNQLETNLYSYVGNNPLRFVDPSGLQREPYLSYYYGPYEDPCKSGDCRGYLKTENLQRAATIVSSIGRLVAYAVRIPFALMPDGTYANETIPSFRGARITLAGAPTLRLRDGSTRVFGQLAVGVTPPTYQLTEIADRTGNRVRIALDFTQQAPIALLDDAGRRLQIGQIQFTYGGPRLIESRG